jgi:hypothetical protein
MLHQASIHLGETEELRRQESLNLHKKGAAGYDKFTFRAISTLFGAFCVHLVIGSQYAWGNIAPYVVGYFRDKGIDTNMSQLYLVLPLIVIISTLFFYLGTKLTYYFGSKGVIFFGGLVTVVFTAFST